MNDKAIYIWEMPTLNFLMNEISEQKIFSETVKNQKIGKLFHWLAAAQIVQILGGAILGFFVAPASLFVSREEAEALWWIVAAVFGYGQITLGVILIPLSLLAANAFRKEKSWRKFAGIAISALALLSFPLGTIFGALILIKISGGSRNSEIVQTMTEQ